MPTQFSALDTGFPTFTGKESTEQKVEALHNFTYMLLEYLRYILRNLGPENMNDAEMKTWLDDLGIKADTIISNTIITNELYSEYGAIADLVVNELRTDYLRAARYLASNTSNLDYLYIHDEEIDFITATVKSGTPTPTEQLHHGTRYFYWTDSTQTEMTSTKVTAYPVTVYQYDELTKASIHFEDVTLRSGVVTRMPVLRMGAGDGEGHDYVELRKDVGEFLIRYYDVSGNTDISMTKFVDSRQRRLSSCAIDTTEGTVTYTLEGDDWNYGLTFTVSGDTVTYTWPDGHSCEVSIT